MTRKQDSGKLQDWKVVLARNEDFLKALPQPVIQKVLEAEMEETLGAGKNEQMESGQAIAGVIIREA